MAMVNTHLKYKNMSLIQNYHYQKKKKWNKVFKTNRYPVLSSLVRPCLSIFMGLMVECSFSMMNDIDFRSGRMEIETYSAIMTTKYSLKSSKSAALKFNRKDILRDPVASTLLYYMHTSSSRYKKCLKTKQDKMLLKKKNLSLKKVLSEVTKKRRKETVHKQVIIRLFMAVF